MTGTEALALAGRLWPIVLFLLAVTLTAELAERAGVFEAAGHRVSRLARGRRGLLWALFAAFAVGVTVVLSLDTTAVLLTPVGLAVAAQVGLDARLLAVTTLWIANTGSLLLPVSNLTNLLALHVLGASGGGHGAFVRTSWAPALVAVVVTLGVIALLHRSSLRGHYAPAERPAASDPLLLRIAAGVTMVLALLFALGTPPWLAASAAAVTMLAVTAWRRPEQLRALPLPWAMAAGFVVLSAVLDVLGRHGLTDLVTHAFADGTSAGALLALAGAGAGLANAVNNLPAYLVLEPAAGESATRLLALLVGTNAGPLVTPWASLATLLWVQRCRSRGVVVPWRWLIPAGLLCAVLVVVTSTLALAVVG